MIGHPEIWYVIGTCGAAVRSLGLYVPGEGATLQLQQAAEFGLDLAKEGRLLAGSRRATVDKGDLYVFETPQGSYSLVRSHSSEGPVGRQKAPLQCEEFTSSNVPYVVLNPILTSMWIELMEMHKEWIWPEEGGSSTRKTIVFRDTSGREIASTACGSDECTIWTSEGETSKQTSRVVTVDELLAAPGSSY